MSDNLIQVNWNDKSATADTVVGSTGATVINSPRGGNEPVYFYPKQTSRILDYFGIPTTTNNAILDILDFNASYPIWVSAPSIGGSYAGVLVTKTGTEAFTAGKESTDSDTFSFSAIPNTELITETPDGEITAFTKTITDYANYNDMSVDITVNDESIEITASDVEPEVLTSTLGAGTFTRATGTLLFTFDTAPLATDIIKVTYTTDRSADAYFALFDKNPQVSDLKVKVALTTNNTFTTYLYKESRTSAGTYKLVSNWPKTLSNIENAKDGFGVNIFMDDYLEDNDYVVAIANTDLAVDTFTDDTTPVLMTGGSRGTTSSTELGTGWEYFKSANKYPVDIFFDITADDAIPAIFETLSGSYQKYSSYILPMANTSAETAITNVSSIMTDDKNISFYWGWGKMYNIYTDSYYASPLTGRIALRYADMYDVYNGLAPAWYNENGTHGGQLGTGISKMFYEADDTAQVNLEAVRINPVIKHPTFGVVCSRERTSQSLTSDYASVGHTRLANYIVSNVVNLLPYQLYKLNDVSHRASVKSQIESILSPLTTDPYNLLREYYVKCDSENNDDTVLQNEEFVVSVAIKFTPFSKAITFNIVNTAQGTSVEDAI